MYGGGGVAIDPPLRRYHPHAQAPRGSPRAVTCHKRVPGQGSWGGGVGAAPGSNLLDSASFSERTDIVVGKTELIGMLLSELKVHRRMDPWGRGPD